MNWSYIFYYLFILQTRFKQEEEEALQIFRFRQLEQFRPRFRQQFRRRTTEEEEKGIYKLPSIIHNVCCNYPVLVHSVEITFVKEELSF